MPDMDGFEAAGRIRREEQGSGRHVPILAMTAHAMKGDRERCLEAGMDGYVAKPIQPRELYEAIDTLTPPAAAAAPPPQAADPPEVADRARPWPASSATTSCSGSWPDCSSTPCLSSWPICGRLLTVANGPAVQRLAHTLKGAVGVFGAHPAFEAALRLETMARAGDLAQAEPAFAALEEALSRLRPILQSWAAAGKTMGSAD